jgi:bacteriocin biosynthesis cyclodehydratase domain-containing protein
MVLRLDPRLPLVWRTPTSLQLGVSNPVVVLDDVTVATERMLAALAGGVPPSGLGMIGRSSGVDQREIDRLLVRLAPALLREPGAVPARVVVVTSDGPTAEAVTRLLAAAGLTVRIARTVAEAERESCDLAVAVGSFVLEPELHGLWLRRDTPHLPVVLGDTAATIGPLVEPGRSACLYCVQRHATDADAAWPAIASQLWGRTAAADTPLVASEAAAIAARRVVGWFALEGAAASGQVVLDAATGHATTVEIAPHPDCGCLEPGFANSEVAAVGR